MRSYVTVLAVAAGARLALRPRERTLEIRSSAAGLSGRPVRVFDLIV